MITGYIYDTTDGSCFAHIKDDVDVYARLDGAKVATVRDGNIYALSGELLGHLGPAGEYLGDPVPDGLRKLCRRSVD